MHVQFPNGKLEEEVYVAQPPGFEDPKNPGKVFKLHISRINIKSSRTHQFFTFKVFMKVLRNTKIFSRRYSFLGIDFSCKYQTPHRLKDLCTLTHALVP